MTSYTRCKALSSLHAPVPVLRKLREAGILVKGAPFDTGKMHGPNRKDSR